MPQPDNSPFDVPTMPAGLEGNLYPRDGASYDEADQYFDEPKERKEDEQEQANEAAATIPFLKQIHEWFDEQIAECDKISNIQLTDLEMPFADQIVKVPRPVSIEAQIYASQLLKQRLQEKKDSFPDLEAVA